MKTKTEINYFPFTENVESKYIRQDILDNPQEFLKGITRFAFGADEVRSHGSFKYMGYYYVLKPFLKNYVYEQYGSWHEAWALNRSQLRMLVGGRINKILEKK